MDVARAAPEVSAAVHRALPNAFPYCSGLKPTRSLPSMSSTGRLIIEGCAAIKVIAFFSLNPS